MTFAAAAEFAPPPASHSMDWEVILFVALLGIIGLVISLISAGLLHRFLGIKQLVLRSVIAAIAPLLLFFALVTTLLVIFDEMSVEGAIRQIGNINANGIAFFAGLFAVCLMGSLCLGWWLRRRKMRAEAIDISVF